MDNWVELLLEIKIILINKELATTREQPQKKINDEIIINTKNPSNEATVKAREIKALQGIENLEVKDKVYLLIKNLRTTRPSKKLNHKKIKLFIVIAKSKLAVRRLQLPKNTKVHSIFNVSLFYLINPDTPLQSTFWYKPEEENKFEVEQILDKNMS